MSPLTNSQMVQLRRALADPAVIAGRYRIVRRLGLGGMGTVYLASDPVLNREVAIKVVDPRLPAEGLQQRLGTEARVLARLEHPGIVPVHDLGETEDGSVFYVMKRVIGQTFDAYCASTSSLASRLRVIVRVCEAVAFAHASGVVHRDLTPSNIMVGSFGEVLTLDWGLAAMVDRATTDGQAGVQGTLGYAAPELSSGGTAISASADIFALGGILEFAVTGRHPENGASGGWPRGLAALHAIVQQARHADASRRYASVSAFADDILRYLDHERVTAYLEPWTATLARWLRRYQWVAALIGAYLVMRLLLAWWSGHQGA